MRLPRGRWSVRVACGRAAHAGATRSARISFAVLAVACPLGFAPGVPAVEGGKLAGKVTDVSTGAAIEGIEVCAHEAGGGSPERCATTDASGEYAVPGLQSGEYGVEFVGAPHYVTQYYDDRASLLEASKVTVTAGETTSGVNAELQPASMPTVDAGQGPQVTGTHKFPLNLAIALVGETLSCASGSWTGSPPPAFTYQWLREGAAIAGATESGYEVQAADEGHSLACEVTATNTAGSGSATGASLKVPRSGSGLGGLGGGGEQASTGEQTSTGEQASGGVGSFAGKKGARVAVTGAVTVRAHAVFVVLHCLSAGRCRAVTAQLVVVERPHSGRVVGAAAGRRRPVGHTVVIGSATVAIGANRSRTVEVPLSPAGRALEVRDRQLAAQVRIIYEGRVVVARKLQIRARR
jgi:hypothetical protein